MSILAVLALAVRDVLADAPVGRFTITNGGLPTGTVYDTKTMLTWQQAVPTSTYTWPNAGTYCTMNSGGLPGTGWRLPSLTELQTIVDDSRVNPAIDPAAFPGTPVDKFWTSSAYEPNAANAWFVDFVDGSTNNGSASSAPYYVRCVR
jgi:hypothetical protein